MSTATGTLKVVSPARPGRFALNLVSNMGQLGLTMMVGAWYVPFLVRQLGPAIYGLIPLTSLITSYMGLITIGLESAVARSLAIALERNDDQESNRIFNVSFLGNLALCLLLLIPAVPAIIEVQHILRIPPGYEAATRWLFSATIAAFLLNQVKTPFAVSMFCRNRLDLQNLVNIAETLTRVGLVIALFLCVAPRVEFVGGAILAGTAVSTVGMIWFWRVLTPNLRIQFTAFEWKMLKHLCWTGGWVLVTQLGVMLYVNIDLVLANHFFGAESSGRYAAVLQLPTLLKSICFAVGGIFAPTMYQIYARGDMVVLADYLNRAIKFVGLIIVLPIGLVCGFARPLLSLWLGQTFGSWSSLLFLMAVHLCINLAMYPLYAVPLAANRVKVPGLVTLGVGLANLTLALVFTRVFGWGVFGLAGAGAITLTLQHVLFVPLYGARILSRPYHTFYRHFASIAVAASAIIGGCWLIQWLWPISTWQQLAVCGLAVSVGYATLVYLFLPAAERQTLKQAVWSRKPGIA